MLPFCVANSYRYRRGVNFVVFPIFSMETQENRLSIKIRRQLLGAKMWGSKCSLFVLPIHTDIGGGSILLYSQFFSMETQENRLSIKIRRQLLRAKMWGSKCSLFVTPIESEFTLRRAYWPVSYKDTGRKFSRGADAKMAAAVGWQSRWFRAPNYDFTPKRTNLQSI